MENITDKVVVITGASSGIGEATALDLAKHGAKVICAARRTDKLQTLCERIKRDGGIAHYKECDVSNPKSFESLAQETIDKYGQIDVLFNNAGLMPLSYLRNLHTDEWERMIDVNIKGVLWGIAAVLPHMLENKGGHIINNSSVAGHHVWQAYAVYSATKHAVRVISEGLRQETDDLIRVTIISPGITKTELTSHITDQEVIDSFKGRFNYFVEADDIARAVRFAIEQPKHVDVSEVIVRASGQPR